MDRLELVEFCQIWIHGNDPIASPVHPVSASQITTDEWNVTFFHRTVISCWYSLINLGVSWTQVFGSFFFIPVRFDPLLTSVAADVRDSWWCIVRIDYIRAMVWNTLNIQASLNLRYVRSCNENLFPVWYSWIINALKSQCILYDFSVKCLNSQKLPLINFSFCFSQDLVKYAFYFSHSAGNTAFNTISSRKF